jgi:riboflavin synthase
MFTGIIEATGIITEIKHENANLRLTLSCPFTQELKIDQSLAHNGCCLTVVAINGNQYEVVAIAESLDKTNLKDLQVGHKVNLERCLAFNGRLDGHMVQGHVDQIGQLKSVENQDGSYLLTFTYDEKDYFTVEKGSICVNGISLTVCNSQKGQFSVAIIPYTWEFTNLSQLTIGQDINLEFDIIGKYIAKMQNR